MYTYTTDDVAGEITEVSRCVTLSFARDRIVEASTIIRTYEDQFGENAHPEVRRVFNTVAAYTLARFLRDGNEHIQVPSSYRTASWVSPWATHRRGQHVLLELVRLAVFAENGWLFSVNPGNALRASKIDTPSSPCFAFGTTAYTVPCYLMPIGVASNALCDVLRTDRVELYLPNIEDEINESGYISNCSVVGRYQTSPVRSTDVIEISAVQNVAGIPVDMRAYIGFHEYKSVGTTRYREPYRVLFDPSQRKLMFKTPAGKRVQRIAIEKAKPIESIIFDPRTARYIILY